MLFLFYCLCFAWKFGFAYGAIHNRVVRALGFAIRVNKVFLYRIGRGVCCKLFNFFGFKNFFALGTFLVLCALCFAGGFGVNYPIRFWMHAIPLSINAHIAWKGSLEKWICCKRLTPFVFIPIPTVKGISILCGITGHFYKFLSISWYSVVRFTVNNKVQFKLYSSKAGGKSDYWQHNQ